MSILTTKRNLEKKELLFRFTNGVVPDAELFVQELKVQKAWAYGLSQIKILTDHEYQEIERALTLCHAQMSEQKFDWRIEDEDIHMNIERFVNEQTAGLGKKMHAGRSRNDLIATTLRLHVADTVTEMATLIGGLISALTSLAETHLDIIIPGMTHLQNGQPIRWSQALMGHAWSLKNDQKSFLHLKTEALAIMPLGSAALSGTTLPIDLKLMAQSLGFSSPPVNSYYCVGDRDSLIKALQVSALFGAHLSRLCEDIIYWASAPVGLVKLPPDWSTGSSIMPNKRNPDIAELARGKAALWIGDATGALSLLKGMPTSYGSDLHESKIPYLRVTQDVKLTLEVFTAFVSGLEPDQEKALAMLNHGHILATEIADHLTQQGLPFREAYAVVAALVELAESKKIQVHELPWQDIESLTHKIEKTFLPHLSFLQTVENRKFAGGTAKTQVLSQIKLLSMDIG